MTLSPAHKELLAQLEELTQRSDRTDEALAAIQEIYVQETKLPLAVQAQLQVYLGRIALHNHPEMDANNFIIAYAMFLKLEPEALDVTLFTEVVIYVARKYARDRSEGTFAKAVLRKAITTIGKGPETPQTSDLKRQLRQVLTEISPPPKTV